MILEIDLSFSIISVGREKTIVIVNLKQSQSPTLYDIKDLSVHSKLLLAR